MLQKQKKKRLKLEHFFNKHIFQNIGQEENVPHCLILKNKSNQVRVTRVLKPTNVVDKIYN